MANVYIAFTFLLISNGSLSRNCIAVVLARMERNGAIHVSCVTIHGETIARREFLSINIVVQGFFLHQNHELRSSKCLGEMLG